MQNAALIAIDGLCMYMGTGLIWLFGRNAIVNTLPTILGTSPGYSGVIFDSLCILIIIATTFYVMFWG